MRPLRHAFALLTSSWFLQAAPILPTPAVTDGSVALSTEDIGGTSLFYLVLTATSGAERYAFHNLDLVNSVAISNRRVVFFAQLTSDAVGPVPLAFGSGGCAPGTCYQNLHTYDWLGWKSNEIRYPTGYEEQAVASGGGVRFTGFTPEGLLTGVIRTLKLDQSAPGPLYSEFSYTWNLGSLGSTPPDPTHMPEPSTAVLLLIGGGVVAVVRRKRRAATPQSATTP